MKTNGLTIAPGYGRDYQTCREALADFRAGKDFKIVAGPYISIHDCKPGDRIYIRIRNRSYVFDYIVRGDDFPTPKRRANHNVINWPVPVPAARVQKPTPTRQPVTRWFKVYG
jgi:hypothetical protein